MRRAAFYPILVLAAGFLLPPPHARLLGQEPTTENTAPATATESSSEASATGSELERAEETKTETRMPQPRSERFEPTEEISEDLSVSFPVDI